MAQMDYFSLGHKLPYHSNSYDGNSCINHIFPSVSQSQITTIYYLQIIITIIKINKKQLKINQFIKILDFYAPMF